MPVSGEQYPTPEAEILELRIHGIKNTPPAEMLGEDPANVGRSRGDDLGGFWVEKVPTGPPEIRREAYSWGQMARVGGQALPMIGQLFVHVGWFLLLPFGLANVAYWTRTIPEQTTPKGWIGGRGAALMRIFALGLTLLLVTSVASVALDIIGVQCFRADQGVCSQLPTGFDALAGPGRGLRLAILALAPLLAIVLLFLLAARARVRYEPNILLEMGSESGAANQRPGLAGPVLATPEFWTRARVAAATERLHLAASVLLLVILLDWDRIFAGSAACVSTSSFNVVSCIGPIWANPLPSWSLAIALVALGWVVFRIAKGSEAPSSDAEILSRRKRAAQILSGAFGLFAANVVLAVFVPMSALAESSPFAGLVATPLIIIAVLLALSISGLGWRRGVPKRLAAALLIAVLVIPLLRYLEFETIWGAPAHPEWYFAATALVVLAQLIVPFVYYGGKTKEDVGHEGWNGHGPGVVMLLSLGVSMVLSSILVVGTAAWIGAPASAGSNDPTGMWRRSNGVSIIDYPDAYVIFGVALLVILLLLLVFLSGVTAVLASRVVQFTTPRFRDGRAVDQSLDAYKSFPPVITDPDSAKLRIHKSRRFAGMTQRGEPILGVAALLFGAGLAATVALSVKESGAMLEWLSGSPVLDRLVSPAVEYAPVLSVGALSAVAAAAIAAIAANALTTKERPVGLLWDLICFLPRAGHPFGPPCFSERVVPELNERIRDWFAGKDGAADSVKARRTVVLSAHSLGAVLATSTVFALRAKGETDISRVGLLTYGTQLRPYFGRFFPELFGAEVLGTSPCGPPSAITRDPWYHQVIRDAPVDVERDGSVVDADMEVVATVAASLTDDDVVEIGDNTVSGIVVGEDAPVDSLSRTAAAERRGATVRARRAADGHRAGARKSYSDPEYTLVDTLSGEAGPPAWVSLWRRTDFLGFPVNSYWANDIDGGTEEYEPRSYLRRIATHGNYPHTEQYEAALEELSRRLSQRL